MTTALQALSRVDDGTFSPADTLLADRYDLHCQAGAFVWPEPVIACLVCGGGDGPECDTCTTSHDITVSRLTDI